MATTKGHLALSFVTAALAAGSLCAMTPQESLRVDSAVSHLMAQRAQLGLDADHAFALRLSHSDALGQTHGHFQQTYKGVRVWGGDVITHTDRNGRALAPTNALHTNIHMNVTPAMGVDEVLAVAHQDLNPKGSYATAPTAELVIYPEMVDVVAPGRSHAINAQDVTRQVVRYTLAYHIHTALENGVEETAHTDYIINANTGAILKKWNTLHSSAALGTGNSQYSGTVQINTNSTSSGFELRDMTRGTGGTFGNNVVTNLNHATSGNGTIYTNSTDTWGDGANYNGGSTTSANGQTAAVDAAYGIQATWDMYKNVLGRNGIDNTGKASYLRVHYSSAYDNAFWDDTCFCMTFGDGSQFKSLESVDVAGHEMSHGVCATSVPGGLTYSGESGGLNEANSDIFGTMVEFYDLGGGEAASATTIPATGGNWTIGEQLETSSFPTPLRYMYKPSKDGTSPDAWYSGVGSLDVHYSSGPMNRCFYFMSQGASATSTSDYYSSYTPAGFTGVGNDHAARIHYRALTTYYTSNETYAQARAAEISAAKDLYGAGSPEEQAVWNAFAAINVGSKWSGGTTANTVTASITTPSGNVTIASGTSQSFVGSATDSSTSATLTYAWTFGDGGTASTASASHTYTNTGTTAVTYTATFKATDNTGATSSATRTITVNPTATSGTTFSEVETNDTIATANAVARTFTAIQGNLSVSTDKDFFALTLNPGETLAIAMTGPTGVDWDLKLVNAAGTQLAISQGSTANENLSYTNTGSTAMTVYASTYVYSGTSTTPYNLALTYSGGTTPPPADTQAPTASATESGTSGTITFNATATDNVGVTKVEFYVDGVLKGTDTTSPYSMTLDSTTLTNATHSLTVKAYDAAGNVGTSTAVSFTVSNTTPPPSSELVTNGGFESGATGWTGTTGDIGTFTGEPAHAGSYDAWLLGNGSTATENLSQSFAIPSTITKATLTFWMHIDTAETTTSTAYDTMKVQVISGTTTTTLATYSNLNKNTGFAQMTFDLSAYKGQTVTLKFLGSEDSSLQTSFVLDDVSVKVQ